jgi:double-stranded uracil-DNA glycosylase
LEERVTEASDSPGDYSFGTLPDYLAPGLRLVFAGINPSIYSVQRGHYFARPSNRFWPAFSRSRLSEPVRAGIGRDRLVPEDDGLLLRHGIGFTDVVKRPTPNAAGLDPADYLEWTPRLLEKLDRYRPLVACFHGVTGYGAFTLYALGEPKARPELGPQQRTIGTVRVYVVPNPSAANAHFRIEDQVLWYDRLADYLCGLRE